MTAAAEPLAVRVPEPLAIRVTRLVWYQTDRHCAMCHWPNELFCGPHCAEPDWPYGRAEYWAT